MNEQPTALIPVEEKQVDFYGDDIPAALVQTDDQEQIYVPLRTICGYLGLAWPGQFMRLKRDQVLSEASRSVIVTITGVGEREMLCLPLKLLPGWLFGINADRVKPELREKIIRYRRDCYDILWQAFQSEIAADRQTPAPSAALVQIRELGLAIVQMAEQQMELDRKVNRAHSRLDQAAQVVKALDQRLSSVERKLTPAGKITDDQAAEVSQAVKALAEYLTTQDKSKNHYQSVFQEIYRRFGVSSYKNIRADQFAAVMKFLEDWQQKGLK